MNNELKEMVIDTRKHHKNGLVHPREMRTIEELYTALRQALAATEQSEPVGYTSQKFLEEAKKKDAPLKTTIHPSIGKSYASCNIPLYTHPPKHVKGGRDA